MKFNKVMFKAIFQGIQQTLQKKTVGFIPWDLCPGIYTVGWNNRRKRPNTVGKRPNFGIILRPRPKKLR